MLSGMVTLFSCEDDKVKPMLSPEITAPVLTSPVAGAIIVLTKPQADAPIAFNWTAADFGVQLAVNYILQIDRLTGDFSNPVIVSQTPFLGDTLTSAQFNASLIALELIPETASPVKARVIAEIRGTPIVPASSSVVNMTVTPFEAKDNIFLVGQHNGWNPATAVRMNRNLPGLRYELYLNLTAVDQGFKILPTLGSWAGDIGEDPANPGRLTATGERNMQVTTPGFWRIRVDLAAMTWSSLRTHWGVIGSATPGGWGSDTDMTFNAATGLWELTVPLTVGEIKFRANDGWDLNFGAAGAPGVLSEGGPNIAIATAGNYTITLNLNPTGTPQVYRFTLVRN